MVEEKVRHCYGIDFGTTNSATVGYNIIGKKNEQIIISDGKKSPIPSVVAINKNNGEVYTGREAWERRQELSKECVYISSVKSLLGLEWSKNIFGKEWTPELVAAEVFKCLQRSVYEKQKLKMDEAVVAIPIGFSARKRKILREAANLAGIEITSFVSEPTAAFFANYKDIRNANTVAVFDWGGGTLDVSILKHVNGKIHEISTGGISKAGDDIDLKLAEKIHKRIARKKNLNIAFNDMPAEDKDAMIVRAEHAKRGLSDDDTTTVSINKYGVFGSVRETIEYDWFEEVISEEVNEAIDLLNGVITESDITINSIDNIIMVGGSSNLRPLFLKMTEIYGNKLYFPEETMWNVGVGAAMLAADPGKYCSNQRIGIRLSDNSLFPLLMENEEIKGWKAQHHFGIVDSNKEARFIFDGSKDLKESDEKYCTLEIPAYKFLQEQIILDVNIDESMVFNAIASSSMRTDEYTRVWKYEKLKCYYKLPKGSGNFESEN